MLCVCFFEFFLFPESGVVCVFFAKVCNVEHLGYHLAKTNLDTIA